MVLAASIYSLSARHSDPRAWSGVHADQVSALAERVSMLPLALKRGVWGFMAWAIRCRF